MKMKVNLPNLWNANKVALRRKCMCIKNNIKMPAHSWSDPGGQT